MTFRSFLGGQHRVRSVGFARFDLEGEHPGGMGTSLFLDNVPPIEFQHTIVVYTFFFIIPI